ncbi:unnamed protein product [Alopecurus aequalis]
MFTCFLRRKTQRNNDRAPVWDGDATEDNIYVDPPKFTLQSLMAATGNFAAGNKLGVREGEQEKEGNLGPVFKLLGVCLERQEKLLVYEYQPNTSLDAILFDSERRRQHLDWEKRYCVIRRIARGMLYLHKESGLRVNLKGILRPSKVPLDNDMKPKILDAGVPPPNTEDTCVFFPDNMLRYAAPEWPAIGKTSTKSDMFSFGVILLEVVTGRGMYYNWRDGKKSKGGGLSYVWDKWKAGSIEDIADTSLGNRYPQNEMRNCVHIGLLCLQEDPKLRPDASTVLQVLDTSCPSSLPTPFIPYGYRV